MQLVLLVALQLLGSLACLASGLPVRLGLALGFLVGLALAVVLALPVLVLGLFTAPVMLGVLGAALAALAWHARDRLTGRTLLEAGLWTAGFAAACVPFVLEDHTIKTYDSHIFIRYAGLVRDAHGLVFEGVDFDTRGIFQVVGHALSLFTGEDFLTGLVPALSLSCAATFVLVLDRALGELSRTARWTAIGLALGVLLAIPMIRLHAIYLHTNWATAVYGFAFVALWCLAEREQDRRYLPIAFLVLLAHALNRVENPMFAIVFLALAGSSTQLPSRAFAAPLLGFALALAGWLGVLVTRVPASSLHLSPVKGLAMIGALAVVVAGCLLRAHPVVRRVFTPRAILLASAVGVLGLAAARFSSFEITFGNWQGDLWARPYWGYFAWPLFALVALASLRLTHPAYARIARYAIGMFFVLVLLLAAVAPAAYYGRGRYADLNRITVHVVPMLAFYLTLVVAPAMAARLRRRA